MFFHRTKCVPYIPQMESTECGAASLAMILAFFDHHAPLPEVRQACGVSRDGASAHGIMRAARSYGLEAEAIRVDMEDLIELPLPAILHWDFHHFLVLEKLEEKKMILVDPAIGRRRVEMEEARKRFTGIAFTFSPNTQFKVRPKRRPSLSRYIGLLRAALPNLGQLLGASLMLQFLGLLFPVANQILLDKVLLPHQESWLWGLAFGLGGATLGRILIGLVRAWVIQGLQTGLDLNLLSRFVGHLVHLPLGFFLQRQTGDLVQRVQSNTLIRNIFTSRSVSALLDGFSLLGFAGLMLAYNWRLALLVLFLSGLRVSLLFSLQEKNQQAMASELAAAGKEGGALVESLSALETIKASGAEARMVFRWAHRSVERINSALERRKLEIFSGQAMVLLQGLSMVVLYGVGGKEVLAERMSVGVFASFITIQSLFMGPLESLLGAFTQLQYLGSHLTRLDDILEAKQEPSGTKDPGRLSGAIHLENVKFAYAPEAPMVIQDVSLSIQPGEKIALVGPSGAGKSTLARLLLGLHLPAEGSIRFGHKRSDRNQIEDQVMGTPIDQIECMPPKESVTDLRDLDLAKARNQMGVVLQETFFFDDTLRANFCLNDPNISLDRLTWACEQACILDVVEALPKKFDSRMGENGSLFSGGQRQRFSMVRALAHDPAILLLDEATSSLDLETEHRLHANLAALGCTRIVIAHRLATVMDADRIFVLQGGCIVQEGDYQTLRRASGLFQDLALAMDQNHD